MSRKHIARNINKPVRYQNDYLSWPSSASDDNEHRSSQLMESCTLSRVQQRLKGLEAQQLTSTASPLQPIWTTNENLANNGQNYQHSRSASTEDVGCRMDQNGNLNESMESYSTEVTRTNVDNLSMRQSIEHESPPVIERDPDKRGQAAEGVRDDVSIQAAQRNLNDSREIPIIRQSHLLSVVNPDDSNILQERVTAGNDATIQTAEGNCNIINEELSDLQAQTLSQVPVNPVNSIHQKNVQVPLELPNNVTELPARVPLRAVPPIITPGDPQNPNIPALRYQPQQYLPENVMNIGIPANGPNLMYLQRPQFSNYVPQHMEPQQAAMHNNQGLLHQNCQPYLLQQQQAGRIANATQQNVNAHDDYLKLVMQEIRNGFRYMRHEMREARRDREDEYVCRPQFLPFSSAEAIEDFEHVAEDEYQHLVRYLFQLGGATLDKAASEILRQSIDSTNNFIMDVTIIRFEEGKTILKKTRFFRTCLAALRRGRRFGNPSDIVLYKALSGGLNSVKQCRRVAIRRAQP